jgi:hypothetical protein
MPWGWGGRCRFPGTARTGLPGEGSLVRSVWHGSRHSTVTGVWSSGPRPLSLATRPALGWLVAIALFPTILAAQEQRGKMELDFQRDIRPILADKCYACHGPDDGHREADLRLDQAASAYEDRGSGAAIVPGDPQQSLLIRRITSEDEAERMPPANFGKELAPRDIDLLRRWVAEGGEYAGHWSFQPRLRAPLPEVSHRDWVRGPIDQWLLAGWEAADLHPSPEADRITLLRRVYFDLTGLPPTPAAAAQFLSDDRPNAYEQVVDRLLASPQFGERLAMYWLDLVRYADTVGYHGDQEHHISPYRDYVIESFNRNLSFDQFAREQLAGDLLAGSSDRQKIATGYNRVLQTSHEGGVQVREYLAKYSADRVRNFGEVWLGLTLGCAECHHHKFDPISQANFYELAAFFADIDDYESFRATDTNPTRRAPEMIVWSPEELEQRERWLARLRQLERRLAGHDAPSSDAPASPGQAAATPSTELGQAVEPQASPDSPEQDAAWKRELEELREKLSRLESEARRTLITVSIEPRDIRVLARGDWLDDSGPVVQPATPAVLPGLDVGGRRATRLDLADWLSRPDHPLTSRVLANRLWYLFFGHGISRSLDDLGSQGEAPTYPELLDELAERLVAGQWDVKKLVREIVTSSAYRQSSLVSDELRERDPENLLFARQSRFRLPAEMIRDQALQAAGLLVHRLGGPSARPYQPEGYYAPLNFPKRTYRADGDGNQFRRGVYMHWQRQFLHPMLRAFDAPSREECVARRPTSNTPLAALVLMNDPTFLEAARGLAERTLREAGPSPEERIEWAWRTVLSRAPDQREGAELLEFWQANEAVYREDSSLAARLVSIGISSPPEDLPAEELAAWTQVMRVLLNLHESVMRE